MSAEQNITDLNLVLPPAPAPLGAYRPIVFDGNIAYLSGHISVTSDGSLITGKVGEGVDAAEGYQAARQAGLVMLSTLRSELGSLDHVVRVIKLMGMVNVAPDFYDLPAVVNGCSELYAELFGSEAGIGARSAVGVASLPSNVTVEIEGIFEVKR